MADYKLGITPRNESGGFFKNLGGFIAERSEFAGFLRDRKARMLAEAAEQERALLVGDSLEQWNETMSAKLQTVTRPDDQQQLQTLIKQGNLAYSYRQSMHPELRQLGDTLLQDVMKAERDFDVRQEAEARAEAATQAANKAALGEQAWKRLNEVADDLQRESLPFITQQAAYHRLTASAKTPSAAGDLALIFNYMKVLDPGSTVREGEAAAVQNAAGVPDIVRTLYNAALRNGERLTPDQRADIVAQSTAMYNAARGDQMLRNGQYLERARDGGVPAELLDSLTVPIGLTQTPQAAAAVVPGAGAPAVAGTGESLPEVAKDTIQGVGDIYSGTRSGLSKLFEALGDQGTKLKEGLGFREPDPATTVPQSAHSERAATAAQKYRASGKIDRSTPIPASQLDKIEEDNRRALEEAGRLYTTPPRRRNRR